MKKHIHYEAAFEDCLRTHQVPYVAVDEAKKASFRDAKLKSFDFIVYSEGRTNWLVDIKGRRWAARKPGGRPVWENWATQADLDGLQQWQQVFGREFAGLLVFAYWLPQDAAPPPEIVHVYRAEQYVFVGVALDDYAQHARVRSPKWETVTMPRQEYRRAVRPVSELFGW